VEICFASIVRLESMPNDRLGELGGATLESAPVFPVSISLWRNYFFSDKDTSLFYIIVYVLSIFQ
jgi:hypothetical protein